MSPFLCFLFLFDSTLITGRGSVTKVYADFFLDRKKYLYFSDQDKSISIHLIKVII